MSSIPETQEMLKKCRIPIGLTLHPFRDLKNLTVIQTNIVRCRYCRTYINPYVSLPDHRHWKCNLCFRANDRKSALNLRPSDLRFSVPEDFLYDPTTKSYGESSQSAGAAAMHTRIHRTGRVYAATAAAGRLCFCSGRDSGGHRIGCVPFFAVLVSIFFAFLGYLYTFAEQFLINLDQMPGNGRTLIGFIAFDSTLHYFEFVSPERPPRELVVPDIEGRSFALLCLFFPKCDGCSQLFTCAKRPPRSSERIQGEHSRLRSAIAVHFRARRLNRFVSWHGAELGAQLDCKRHSRKATSFAIQFAVCVRRSNHIDGV